MEQWRNKLDLGRSGGEVVLEDDLAFVEPALPGGPFLPGDPEPALENQLRSSRRDLLLTPTTSGSWSRPGSSWVGR